jgi:CheY-like chemotaxis protein
MEAEKPRVLIVDDSRGDIRIVNENLKEQYTTLAATNGEKALELASQEPRPDVILMDVEMPGMTGYETCEKLKANPDTRDIDIIFVSAHDTVDEIVAGYDAGGTDYLTKPIEPLELKRKIKIAVNNRRHRSAISIEKLDAAKVAMTAMSSAGEQGVVIEFLRQSFKTTSLEALAELIVSTVDQYDLNNAVQVRSLSRIVDRASNDCVVPLEQELLIRLKDHNRVIEKGHRAIFNFGDISLLIKNICLDADKWGRIRDHLSLLLEGAHEKYLSLVADEHISTMVKTANSALQKINEMQKTHKVESQRITDKMLVKVEGSFNSLGLTDEQEELLLGMIQEGVNESLSHIEKGFEIDKAVKKIINQLTIT